MALTDIFLDKADRLEVQMGRLPHWHQQGKAQFVTFRLRDSLPQHVVDGIKEAKAAFAAMHPEPWDEQTRIRYVRECCHMDEHVLDRGHGSCILRDPDIRAVVEDAIMHYHPDRYRLLAYVIMPNHVHLLAVGVEDTDINKTVGAIKSYTSHALATQGLLWQREHWDTIIRSADHLRKVSDYILTNPRHLPAEYYSLYVSPELH